MIRPSEKFLIKLKLNQIPAYKIAQQAGLDPTVLSKLINGIEPIKSNDQRIIKIAAVLGLNPDEAFSEHNEANLEKR